MDRKQFREESEQVIETKVEDAVFLCVIVQNGQLYSRALDYM